MQFCSCVGLVLTLAVLASSASEGDAPRASSGDRRINAVLERVRKKYDLPGMAAAVVNSEGLVAVGAVGVRKRGERTPVTPDDQFHLGSDTKAMTAALIGRLVEAGKLRWDTPLERVFPKLAPSMSAGLRRATLVHLLSHHAGLPANIGPPGGWRQFACAGSIRLQREAVVRKAALMKLLGNPGDRYSYSNVGYVVAGAMAERVADASWEDLMTEQVFRPLGMSSAGFGPAGSPGTLDQPWPHDDSGTPREPGPQSDNPPVLGPAGCVHCSLPDWAKFVADQLRGARGRRGLLRPETYKRLHTSPFPDHFYTVGGWTGRESPEVRLEHDGSNRLNYATALLLPARDLAILVATNEGEPGGPGEKGCLEARDALLRQWTR